MPTELSASLQLAEPHPTVVLARELGPMDQGGRIVGRDGGYSAPFRGSVVWIFGDTFVRTDDDDEPVLQSSSWARSAAANGFDADAPGLEQPTHEVGVPKFLALTPDEERHNATQSTPDCAEPACAWWTLWPSAMVADPERDRLLVTYAKLRQWNAPFGFQAVGSSIATWDDLERPALRANLGNDPEEPTLMKTDLDGVTLGSAAVVEGEHLYLFQCGRTIENAGDAYKGCRLARAPLAQALERDAWTYLACDGRWSLDRGDAITLFEGNSIMSVGFSAYLGGYLATYSVPASNEVDMRFAKSLVGPWSESFRAFSAPAPSELWIYDAMAHPELQKDDGQLQYVTYSRRTGGASAELRLVEVELGR